jgi:hypothetical protein
VTIAGDAETIMGLQPQEKKKKKGKIGENWSQKLL